jgi:hypothetical protein
MKISMSLLASQGANYTANRQRGLLHRWHDRDNPSWWAAGLVFLDGPDHGEKS